MAGFLGKVRASWVLSGALLALSTESCTSNEVGSDSSSGMRSGCSAGLEACPCRERGELCDRGLACVAGVCVYAAPNHGLGGGANDGFSSAGEAGSDAGSGGSS